MPSDPRSSESLITRENVHLRQAFNACAVTCPRGIRVAGLPTASSRGTLRALRLWSVGFAGVIIKDAVPQRWCGPGDTGSAEVCGALVPGGSPLPGNVRVCPQLVDRRWRVGA
jgi:hypothetical protein